MVLTTMDSLVHVDLLSESEFTTDRIRGVIMNTQGT